MNTANYTIDAFPSDNQKYIVKNFGLIRKNTSSEASVYLVEVFIQSLDTDKKLTIEVLLTLLHIVRIGSIWKNKKLIYNYACIEKKGFKKRNISLSLNNSTSPSIKLLVKDKETSKKSLIDINELNKKKFIVLSVFTVFVTDNGTQVFIPSLEILLSTYTPHTHTVVHNLAVAPSIDEVIKKYVIDCIIDNDAVYTVNFKSNYSASTIFFLAFLSCNNKTRRNVSKINSSIKKNIISRANGQYSFLEVFPYHPKEFNIKALGLYDEGNKRFWVHQITTYSLPSCCEIFYQELEKTNDEIYKKDQLNLINEEVVIESLKLINDIDAGRNAGKKYIKTEINIITPWNKLHKKKTKYSTSCTGKVKPSIPTSATASPLSGQNSSKTVAAVEYGDMSNEHYLTILTDAIYKLNKEYYFLMDNNDRIEHLVFCSLPKKRTFRGNYSNWAFISKNRPRRLLVCEICLTDKFVYILDIERKKKETYAGIIFSSNTSMDLTLLNHIKDTISINQGRFSGDKKRLQFPVTTNYKTFRHYSNKAKMESSIFSIIETI